MYPSLPSTIKKRIVHHYIILKFSLQLKLEVFIFLLFYTRILSETFCLTKYESVTYHTLKEAWQEKSYEFIFLFFFSPGLKFLASSSGRECLNLESIVSKHANPCCNGPVDSGQRYNVPSFTF